MPPLFSRKDRKPFGNPSAYLLDIGDILRGVIHTCQLHSYTRAFLIVVIYLTLKMRDFDFQRRKWIFCVEPNKVCLLASFLLDNPFDCREVFPKVRCLSFRLSLACE